MKRFTETNKWRDPWFRRLSAQAKQLWEYLRDNCDAIGLIEIDLSLASSDCGQEITEAHISELGDRVQRISEKKLFLPKFINFQYGELKHSCPPHRSIIKLDEAHGLIRVGLLYAYPTCIENPYPNARVALPLRQDKTRQDKEKTVHGESEGEPIPSEQPELPTVGGYHRDSRTVLHYLNEKCGRHFRETDSNLTFISSRMKEDGVDLVGVKTMIDRQTKRWKGTSQEEYLRPETLFNKTKFDSYYASKDAPIHEKDATNGSKRNDRNFGTGVDLIERGKRTAAAVAADNPPPA